tara:strand:- start:1832 stop:2548 length:717 start_codon:yes stop_codon:yes gene_type:complete
MKKFFYNTPAFRYIFEIVVIVFSVTLSFYIQDLLNERDKIELKNVGLNGVKSDLQKDLDFFSLGIDIMYSRVKNIDSILDKEVKNKNEFVSGGARRYFGFIGQDSNYRSMISTGSIEYINSKKLFKSVNQYYGRDYDLLKDYSEQDEENFNDVNHYLNDNFFINSSKLIEISSNEWGYDSLYNINYDNNTLQKMQFDKKFINKLINQRWMMRIYLIQLKLDIEKIRELNILIDNELKE